MELLQFYLYDDLSTVSGTVATHSGQLSSFEFRIDPNTGDPQYRKSGADTWNFFKHNLPIVYTGDPAKYAAHQLTVGDEFELSKTCTSVAIQLVCTHYGAGSTSDTWYYASLYSYSANTVYTRVYSGHNFTSCVHIHPKAITWNPVGSSFNKLTISGLANANYRISVSHIIDTSDFELVGENLYTALPDTGTYKIPIDLSNYTWVMISSRYTKNSGTEWQQLILNVPTHQFGCLQTWAPTGNAGRNYLAVQVFEDSINIFIRQNNNYGYIWNVWGYR